MRYLIKVLGLMAPLLFAIGPNRAVSADERDEPKRMVLVELYTSQGCDMCPTAEKMLGGAGRAGPQDRADRLPCRLLQ